MGLDSWEQAVIKKWKTLRNLDTFLKVEIEKINRDCFQNKLELPNVVLRRMKFSRGLLGGFFGADYQPPKKGRLAKIGIFPVLLLNRKDAKIALAHEMVHHWEQTTHDRSGSTNYPPEVDQLIDRRFEDPIRRGDWRSTHSTRYLAKACEVAGLLKIPIKDFLFKDREEVIPSAR